MANLPTEAKPRIKWVRKASQWCKTYFVPDKKNGWRQVQEWSLDKPTINAQ